MFAKIRWNIMIYSAKENNVSLTDEISYELCYGKNEKLSSKEIICFFTKFSVIFGKEFMIQNFQFMVDIPF